LFALESLGSAFFTNALLSYFSFDQFHADFEAIVLLNFPGANFQCGVLFFWGIPGFEFPRKNPPHRARSPGGPSGGAGFFAHFPLGSSSEGASTKTGHGLRKQRYIHPRYFNKFQGHGCDQGFQVG